MEEKIFPAPAVAEELQGFIEARMHTDHYDDKLKKMAQELQLRMVQSVGAPMYVIIDPSTEEILGEAGYTSEEGFVAFLKQTEGE